MKLCTCTKCGWVHMQRTRAQVEAEVAEFMTHWVKMTPEVQAMYGGKPATVADQESCFLCRGREFRDFVEGDCPTGCTIQGVIREA